MLTALQIKGFKASAAIYRKSDINGLYLTIYPNGNKKWEFRFLSPVTNKRRTLRIGDIRYLSLLEARNETIGLN